MGRDFETRIDFGWRAHGWLPVSLTIGGFDAQVRASITLNDPVEELLDMAIFAITGRSGMRRFCLWMEPEGLAFDVWPVCEMTVGVRVYHDESMVPPGLSRSAIEIHQGAAPRRALAGAVYAGLSTLLEWRGMTAGAESDLLWIPGDPSTAYPAKLAELERLLVTPRPEAREPFRPDPWSR